MRWVSAVTERGFWLQRSRLHPNGLVGWIWAGIGSTGMALMCYLPWVLHFASSCNA